MRKILKVIFVLFVVTFIAYSGFWFYSAYKLRQVISQYSINSHNKLIKFSYQDLSVGGFPFNASLKFSDVNLTYPNVFEFKIDLMQVKSNILLSCLDVNILGKVVSDIMIQGNRMTTDSIYKKPFEIKLLSDKKFNTLSVIKSIYKQEFPSNIKIKEIHINKKDTEIFYHNSLDKISRDSGNLVVLFERPNNDITNVTAKTDINSEIFDISKLAGEEIYFPFKNISLSNEIILKSKGEGENHSFPYIHIKDFSIKLDDFKVSFSAVAQTQENDSKLEADVNLTQWENLLELLVKDQQLSEEKRKILITLFKEITEEENLSNPIKFKIKKEGNEIIIGTKPLFHFFKYSKYFILSK